MTFALLAAELDGFVEAMVAGDSLPLSEIEGVLSRAHGLGPAGNADEWPLLQAAFQRLAAALVDGMASTEDDLRELGRARTAMAAYGTLKPHTTAQRVRKQA